MIYQLGFFSEVGASIRQALRTLCGRLAAILYDFIVDEYNVFMYIARTNVLSNEYIQSIYNKVGLILGLFMLFKLMFSLVKSLVDPSQFSNDKNGFGKIIQRSVIAIVLLGITPSLFNAAFDLQRIIVGTDNSSNNVIYKFIVGSSVSTNADDFGQKMAADLYFTFFKEAPGKTLNLGSSYEVGPDGAELVVDNYSTLYANVQEGKKSFDDTVDYLILRTNGAYVIEWNELFSIGVALIVIWLLISYCIQVATRVIQLAYLQLIAPIPILSYISDPDGTFKSWTKQCITTYLDLFLRMAVIYFIIKLSNDVLTIFDAVPGEIIASTGLTVDSPETKWVKVFLVLGLLMFGKKVPELLKDLFPNLGGGAASLGFGLMKPKDVPGYGFAKGAATFGLGAVVGGAAGLATGIKHGEGIKGKIAGAFGGLGRGMTSSKTKGNIFKNAQAGMNSTRAARQRAYEKNHDGSTFWGRHVTSGGAARTVDEFDRESTFYDNYISGVEAIKKELAKNEHVQRAQSEYDRLMQTGVTRSGSVATAQDYKKAKEDIKRAEQIAYRMELHRPGSNPGLRAQIDRLDRLGTEGKKHNYDGFSGFTLSTDTSVDENTRVTAFWDTEKKIKNENADIKTPGGKKYKERETAKANAKYNKSGK